MKILHSVFFGEKSVHAARRRGRAPPAAWITPTNSAGRLFSEQPPQPSAFACAVGLLSATTTVSFAYLPYVYALTFLTWTRENPLPLFYLPVLKAKTATWVTRAIQHDKLATPPASDITPSTAVAFVITQGIAIAAPSPFVLGTCEPLHRIAEQGVAACHRPGS